MPQLQDSVSAGNSQNCVARALYDNIAESPDELAFQKGDILTVLEQNTSGLEGWWLCALKGRQGIVPGNRLRLLAGIYETGSDFNTLQRQGKRRSWHVQPNKVLTPQKFGDVYLYDMPTSKTSMGQEQYDVPPSAHVAVVDTPHDCFSMHSSESYSRPNSGSSISDSYDTPRPLMTSSIQQQNSPAYDTPRPLRVDDSYDIPRPNAPVSFQVAQSLLTPSSSISSLNTNTTDSLSGPSSNRSSFIPEYDVPRGKPIGGQLQLHQLLADQNYDVPSTNPQHRELPLELNSALECLARLESEATTAICKLLGFAGPQWREREKLESKLMDIKLVVLRLQTSLHDLTEFGEGALGNAMKNFDNGLAGKLRPMVKALKNADFLIQSACASLEAQDWSIEKLAKESDYAVPFKNKPNGFDALDQIVSCAKDLTEDVRQTASFIQGNSTLLFKRSESTSPDDYDYVNLDKAHHKEVLESLPPELQKSYSLLIKQAKSVDLPDVSNDGESFNSDKQVLSFYAIQASTHASQLMHAIDAFLQTVEHNQPPKVFLAHGKFVVLSAHRLVYIGDTVHRNINDPVMKGKVLHCANALCECLAATVHKTKKAAMQFPSVSAVQEMVDSIVDVSHLARDLKMCLVIGSQQNDS
ncbi:unnamed protein product [Bemisia tabaci]|uniref:Breast cancer anti-estrogen resistance protein 1 n=1 Tax=Bemisia tabaci TaxID=7038 RepID=A0A9P0AC35_BEMTA|nr:unnamed protein product [Bemisia tabaci]